MKKNKKRYILLIKMYLFLFFANKSMLLEHEIRVMFLIFYLELSRWVVVVLENLLGFGVFGELVHLGYLQFQLRIQVLH